MDQESDEISLWIDGLRRGDTRAPERIWQSYFEQLVRLARRKMSGMPRRAVDEEDVALSAMNSLFRGVDAGRFPKLDDRDDLWKILVTITARKAIKHQRRHFAEKRGGGRVHGESIFMKPGDESESNGLDQVLGSEPTDWLADQVTETCSDLMERLDDEKLRLIVCLKLEGCTNEEISQEMNCSIRTVERKLERIRGIWAGN